MRQYIIELYKLEELTEEGKQKRWNLLNKPKRNNEWKTREIFYKGDKE